MENLTEQKRDIRECQSIWDVLAEAIRFAAPEVNAVIDDAYANALKSGGYLDL